MKKIVIGICGVTIVSWGLHAGEPVAQTLSKVTNAFNALTTTLTHPYQVKKINESVKGAVTTGTPIKATHVDVYPKTLEEWKKAYRVQGGHERWVASNPKALLEKLVWGEERYKQMQAGNPVDLENPPPHNVLDVVFTVATDKKYNPFLYGTPEWEQPISRVSLEDMLIVANAVKQLGEDAWRLIKAYDEVPGETLGKYGTFTGYAKNYFDLKFGKGRYQQLSH